MTDQKQKPTPFTIRSSDKSLCEQYQMSNTIVWEKLTVGYFHVKIILGKIFSSLGVSTENFLTTKYFSVKVFVPLLTNLMHNYIHKHAQL